MTVRDGEKLLVRRAAKENLPVAEKEPEFRRSAESLDDFRYDG